MLKRASFFLLSALAAFPAAALADNAPYVAGSVPVSINACAPMISGDSQTAVAGIPLMGTSSGIRIQFTNDTAKTANLINFAVKSNGSSFVIRDVGTFSPGIEITHKFRNGYGQAFALPAFIAPKIQCAVDSVHFTDGTVWSSDARAQAAASQSPAPGSALLTASPTIVNTSMKAGMQFFMVTSGQQIAGFSERDSCSGIADVRIVASGGAAATYRVKPLSRGSCSATIRDEDGREISVGINVQ